MNQTSPSRCPQVAIVGRPNVGKSTLFNRLVGSREAIVGSQYGLTRDRHLAEADWAGVDFELVDTGGLELGSPDDVVRQVEAQVMAAVETADAVLFLVDGRDGPLPIEADIADTIRRHGIPTLLVVNKCDTAKLAEDAPTDFHGFGIEPILAVSAEQGLGVGEMLDALVEVLPAETGRDEERPESIAVAVVGRPNVGKSSLVNALLGAPRVIVSDRPGTTRDAIDTLLEKDSCRYLLVDTAGIRKRARVDTHAEIASVAMARKRMRRADVALLLVDPYDGVTRQDLHIAAEAEEAGCGLVVVVNKWDTVPPEEGLVDRFRKYIGRRLGRMSYAPITFTSATEGKGVPELLPLIDDVDEVRSQRIPTAELNDAFETMVQRHAPSGGAGSVQPKYLTQVSVRPPTFVAFMKGRGRWGRDYRRYLENRLRENFDFAGTPLVIRVRSGSRRLKRAARGRQRAAVSGEGAEVTAPPESPESG